METVVVGCMCVQSTMVEGTCIMKIQPKGDLLPEAIIFYCLLTKYYHGNCTNRVPSCAEFDAHAHYLCQVLNSNMYYPLLPWQPLWYTIHVSKGLRS